MTIKVLTVLGARPQFIKAGALSRVIKEDKGLNEIILHTGQHFDDQMSTVFFDQLQIPKPKYNLGISSLSHGAMTGRMIEKIENVITLEKPDWLLVYGDTNSTLAGAIAASKMKTKVAHVEAGLRSHNAGMPEEINRILTDRVSSLLLCPTEGAVKNLINEGFPFVDQLDKLQKIENVGDVMLDAALFFRNSLDSLNTLQSNKLIKNNYAVCTLHRQENVDDQARLNEILNALNKISENTNVILPLHPRTKNKLLSIKNIALNRILIIDPLPYLEMQQLIMNSKFILTDSGGVQKEAYFYQIPCITLRDETEWNETVSAGANVLAGACQKKIIESVKSIKKIKNSDLEIFGGGTAAGKIAKLLVNYV